MKQKKIHYNHDLESNVLFCGALKEPEKLVYIQNEESLFSNKPEVVTCKRCLSKLAATVAKGKG